MAKRAKSIETKRLEKRGQLLERLGALPGVDSAVLEQRLTTPLRPSVRINPLKADPADTLAAMELLGWRGEPVAWCEHAFTIMTGFEQLRDSPLADEGAIYLQNSSSWLPVLALDPQPGERILDVCAAPGGKTSHVAALVQGQGTIVANDNSRPRLMRMQRNLERLGVQGVEFSLRDASQLARHLEGELFDRIVLDAPCSGEGLINLDKLKDLDTWSVAHIKRLSQLQKRVLGQAWQLLRPGGTLVYSTCTTAPEENEVVIDWLLRRASDAELRDITIDNPRLTSGLATWQGREFSPEIIRTRRILPGDDGQEMFYVARLVKKTSVPLLH